MQLVRTICERWRRGLDRDPRELAASLGKITNVREDGALELAPSDPAFTSATILVDAETGEARAVELLPSGHVDLAALKALLGPYDWRPRAGPYSKRRYRFGERDASDPDDPDPAHELVALVEATVEWNEPHDDTARVMHLEIDRYRADALMGVMPEEPTAVWPRLLGAPARFALRSWCARTLAEVCADLESAIGVVLVEDPDGTSASTWQPACELRLRVRPACVEKLQVFDLVGTHGGQPEDISGELAIELRSELSSWYIPDEREQQQEAALATTLLEREAIIEMIAPRQLGRVDDDEREEARALLEALVESWLLGAQRREDPRADFWRRWAAFEDRSASYGRSALMLLRMNALDEPLYVIEEVVFDLEEMTAEQRIAANASQELAQWRAVADALAEPIAQLDGPSRVALVEHHAEVIAKLEDFGKRVAT